MQKVIGSKNVNYTNRNGQLVVGVEITVATELPSDQGFGFTAQTYFIRNRQLKEFPLGEIITVLYEPGFNGNPVCCGVLYKDTK